jgi:hypothetical protein
MAELAVPAHWVVMVFKCCTKTLILGETSKRKTPMRSAVIKSTACMPIGV